MRVEGSGGHEDGARRREESGGISESTTSRRRRVDTHSGIRSSGRRISQETYNPASLSAQAMVSGRNRTTGVNLARVWRNYAKTGRPCANVW